MKSQINYIPSEYYDYQHDRLSDFSESFGFDLKFISENMGKSLSEIIQLVSDLLKIHKDSDKFVPIHFLLSYIFKETKSDVICADMMSKYFKITNHFYYHITDFIQQNNIETHRYYIYNLMINIMCVIKRDIYLLSSLKIFNNYSHLKFILFSFEREFFFKDLGLSKVNLFGNRYESSGNYILSKKMFFDKLNHFIDVSNHYDYIKKDDFKNKNRFKESLYLMYVLKNVIFKNLILKQDLSSLKVLDGDFKKYNTTHVFDDDDINIESSRGYLRHNMDYIGYMIPIYLLYGIGNILVGTHQINDIDNINPEINVNNSFSYIEVNKTIHFSEIDLNILNSDNQTLINFSDIQDKSLYKKTLKDDNEYHNLYVCNEIFLKYARRHMETMTNEELKNLFDNILNSKFNDGFFIKSLHSKHVIEIFLNIENEMFKGLTFIEKESKQIHLFSNENEESLYELFIHKIPDKNYNQFGFDRLKRVIESNHEKTWLVSQLRNMNFEYRIFIVNNKVVCGTLCHRDSTPMNMYPIGKFNPHLCLHHKDLNLKLNQKTRDIVAKYIRFARQFLRDIKLHNEKNPNNIYDESYILDVAINDEHNEVIPIEINDCLKKNNVNTKFNIEYLGLYGLNTLTLMNQIHKYEYDSYANHSKLMSSYVDYLERVLSAIQNHCDVDISNIHLLKETVFTGKDNKPYIKNPYI